jgi:hypothetical protein
MTGVDSPHALRDYATRVETALNQLQEHANRYREYRYITDVVSYTPADNPFEVVASSRNLAKNLDEMPTDAGSAFYSSLISNQHFISFGRFLTPGSAPSQIRTSTIRRPQNTAYEEDNKGTDLGNVIRIDDERVRDHLGRIVRGTIGETLHAILEAEADRLCNAERYERRQARRDQRSGSYERKLQTKAGQVTLKVPKLRVQTFERPRPLANALNLRCF